MPGITGLRGVAVAAVVAYHLGYLPGGFIGVDVFFVLSGFLITSLLLRNTPTTAAELGRWWSGRFTRLTPAVVVVVIAVLIAFATVSGITLDSIATLTWWQNWHLILEGTPYWSSDASPLRHTWSLSIEEQFYAVWPPVMILCLALARRLRGRRPQLAVAGVAITLGTASFAWAAHLAMAGGTGLSRIYFGTDTRAGGLLLGCAAAAVLHDRAIRAASHRLTAAAVVASLGIAVLAWTVTPETRWTYTGGLLAVTGCSLILILAARCDGPVTTAMSWTPLQWLGVRSYAIYLWSWPIQLLLQDRAPGLPLVAVAAITVLVSLGLSALSLRLIEEPMRHASAWARRLTPRRTAWFGGAVLLAVAMVFATNSTQLTATEQVAKEFERLPDPTVPDTTTTTCAPPPPAAPAPTWSDQSTQFERATVEKAPDPTVAAECGRSVRRVLIVGDSTGRGAANGLRRLAPPDLEVWDRTDLGCGLVSAEQGCPDWRTVWPAEIAQIQPDVALVYLRTSDDLVNGEDPPFLSAEAAALRQSEMATATQLLSSGGAKVIWVLPATPLRRGSFYCDGDPTDTPCDGAWVTQWRTDVAAVAAQAGAGMVDVQQWIDSRPDTVETDRPDGLHFSGPALDQHASWVAEQIRGVSP